MIEPHLSIADASTDDASLVLAAAHGQLPMVKLLLSRGANARADHHVALSVALEHGHAAVVALLTDAGASSAVCF